MYIYSMNVKLYDADRYYSLRFKDHILCNISNLLLTYACLHFRNQNAWVTHITEICSSLNLYFIFPRDPVIKVFFSASGISEHCLNMCPQEESTATATLPRSECQLTGQVMVERLW